MTASQRHLPEAKPVRAATAKSRLDILSAASECFKEQGYSATSIDDVAHRLRATKGMIYHHFRSKTDLFFEVYRHGMEMNFAKVRPFEAASLTPLRRLAYMGYAHAVNMMAEQAYQRTQLQGITMHQSGATTAAQRETLLELVGLRDEFEAMFRRAVEAAIESESLPISDSSLAVKNFISVLNSTVFWYSPRGDNIAEEQQRLALDVLDYALRGLGAEPPQIDMTLVEKIEKEAAS